MARCDRANPDSRNFGLGSRDMGYAGRSALREGMQSHSSIATMADRWGQFASWAREEAGIRDMRHIETATLRGYAAHLIARLEQGEISPATAQNALSAVNRVMEIARGDRAVRLDPVREAGLPTRSGIATTDHAVPVTQHDTAVAAVSERVGALLSLQRSLGLRFEEAAKLDAQRALAQAERHGQIRIEDGTKGGLVRQVPCQSPAQHHALAQAAAQQEGRSLIPPSMSYKDFRTAAYSELRSAGIRSHGERHAYAQGRYETLVGAPAPVAAGIGHGADHHRFLAAQLGIEVAAARELDLQAREQVAAELGHGRIDVTNAYLG